MSKKSKKPLNKDSVGNNISINHKIKNLGNNNQNINNPSSTNSISKNPSTSPMRENPQSA